LVLDMIVTYTSHRGIHNNIITNTWSIIEFSFYLFVLRQVVLNIKIKKLIVYAILLYSIFSFINIFFVQHFDLFNAVNFTIGTVITVSFCIYYFIELFQKAEVQSLARLPSFWIISGIMFNVVLIFPTFAFLSFIESTKVNRTSIIILHNISAIFNIISILTYILYSIGILCRIRTIRSTL